MRSTGRPNERLCPPPTAVYYYPLTQLSNAIKEAARKHLSGKKDLVLVDLGCGSMPYRPLFEAYVGNYVGVDLQRNPLAHCHADPQGKTPLPDAFADVVLSTQVLEHVAAPLDYLRECRRLLKPGGLLILSTHGYWVYHPDPQDLWRWTSEGLKRIVQDAGFTIVEFRGLLGLASAALQLLQDALMPAIPQVGRRWFWYFMQRLVKAADQWASPAKRDQDASIYVVVARK